MHVSEINSRGELVLEGTTANEEMTSERGGPSSATQQTPEAPYPALRDQRICRSVGFC